MTAGDDDLDSRVRAFFAGRPDALALFEVVRAAILDATPASIRVTKSQVSFSRRRGFAWAWTPDRYLRGPRDGSALAPLVLSLALLRRDPSSRWKEIVEPTPGRWMHHLEVRDARDMDDEVRAWIDEAARHAG